MMERGIGATRWLGLVLVFIAAVLGGCAGEKKLERFEFTRLEMGVRARVVLYAPTRQTAEAAAMIAFATIGGLDGCMSDYRKDSELMQLCAQPEGQPVRVSRDLFTVLAAAKRVAQASDGAFDVTVGPAVSLWRAARKSGRLSSPEEVQSARERVDWRRVELDEQHRTVTLRGKGMQLDLGGIAKGYAAAEAVAKLRSRGFPQSMVALAGDIAAGDAPPGEEGWKIDVMPPTFMGDDVDVYLCNTLLLANASVSTSGDSEQFVEIDGRRYSHIVDPRTALPMTTSVQATVVGRDGAVVDAVATALCVLGSSRAAEVSESLGVSSIVSEGGAVVVSDEGGRLKWSK